MYTVTIKHRCMDHTKISLVPSGLFSCHIAYVNPKNYEKDGLLPSIPQVKKIIPKQPPSSLQAHVKKNQEVNNEKVIH